MYRAGYSIFLFHQDYVSHIHIVRRFSAHDLVTFIYYYSKICFKFVLPRFEELHISASYLYLHIAIYVKVKCADL